MYTSLSSGFESLFARVEFEMSIWCVLMLFVGSPQIRSGRQTARVMPVSPRSQRLHFGAACARGGLLTAHDVNRSATELYESGGCHRSLPRSIRALQLAVGDFVKGMRL